MLAIAAIIVAPYAMIMTVPRTSHAVIAAIAISVPTALALRHTHMPRVDIPKWVFEIDAILLVATLASIGLAVFVRLTIAVLGERAKSRPALVAINMLGVAVVAGTLQWWGGLLERLPIK